MYQHPRVIARSPSTEGRRGDFGHFPCHSEGAERLKNLGYVRGIRDCHVEFTPSRVRFFAALRMTQGEGLAMTINIIGVRGAARL